MNRTEEIKQGCRNWFDDDQWFDDDHDQYQCIPSELCPSCLARLDERQRALREELKFWESRTYIISTDVQKRISEIKAELVEKE
jgi:hypothetical protein